MLSNTKIPTLPVLSFGRNFFAQAKVKIWFHSSYRPSSFLTFSFSWFADSFSWFIFCIISSRETDDIKFVIFKKNKSWICILRCDEKPGIGAFATGFFFVFSWFCRIYRVYRNKSSFRENSIATDAHCFLVRWSAVCLRHSNPFSL